jgi:hypothetical protein
VSAAHHAADAVLAAILPSFPQDTEPAEVAALRAKARRAASPGRVNAAALPDESAIAELERLANLDPDEQRAKALAEINEPKRKG